MTKEERAEVEKERKFQAEFRARELQERALEAKRILEAPLVSETLSGMHDAFVQRWRLPGNQSSQAMREELYALDQNCAKFEALLTLVMERGINQAKLDLVKLQNGHDARADGGGEPRRT